VVEDIRDVMAIENTASHKGLYHVLGGKISPIDGVGPHDLNIVSLVDKVKNGDIKELIFALSPTMEGDTTNFYIYKQIQDYNVETSTIARGISVGDELDVRYFLELCLQSVEASIQDLDAEIIVVDNNSKDESCTMVKQKFPNVKLIENKDNLGFSKGNNTGVVKAKGEYVCILNPDTVVTETTFKNLLNIADTKDKLGILGCQLIDGTGQFLPESKRNIPTPNVAIKKALGNSKQYYANHIDKDAST